jgi:subtilisin family serine protease
MLKEYFVVVADPSDKEIIRNELMSDGGIDPIPARSVECINEMNYSDCNFVFLLTDEEAEKLRSDIRVIDVHLKPKEQGLMIKIFGSRPAVYDKTFNLMQNNFKNWGLARCISQTENFGLFNNTLTNYTFNLTGNGVDVIIVDTGVEPNHPELAVNADGTGGSRVVDYDWTQHGIISSAPTGGFLGDCDGHGTHTASVIAGNTCGWAPNAQIYSLRTVPSTGGTERDITDDRILGLVDDLEAWQTIRLFHLSKSPDPVTGYRRPTIVNASYGYINSYVNVTSITHRGTTYSINTTSGLFGTIGINEGNFYGTHGARVSSIDAEVRACIAAGVIVVGAAGNDFHKIDVNSGLDYNNFWTRNSVFNFAYHRGSTPGAVEGVICVGAISYSLPEHKFNFSCTGPRVDLYAPGGAIVGASESSISSLYVQDSRNSSYWLTKKSGTSEASPQVAGVAALILELRPQLTGTNLTNLIKGVAVSDMLDEDFYGQSGTYTNFASLQGGNDGYLYMPFNDPNPLTIS